MTVIDSQAPKKRWSLTRAAEGQMEALGIDAADVIGVIRKPASREASVHPGRERWRGDGITLVVENMQVLNVYIDGADRQNWEDAARKRAQRQLQRQQARASDQPVYSTSTGDKAAVEEYADNSYVYAVPAMPKGESKENPVTRTNLLDSVHPALRATVLEELAGDFTRLNILSPTRVEILDNEG